MQNRKKHLNQEKVVIKLKKIFSRDEETLFVYLFGSLAYEESYPSQDIDIGIYLEEKGVAYYYQHYKRMLSVLIDELESDKIDLFVINMLPLIFQHQIITEGKLIFSRDEKKRVDFEIETLYRYFDFKPYLDEYNSVIREKIMRGR